MPVSARGMGFRGGPAGGDGAGGRASGEGAGRSAVGSVYAAVAKPVAEASGGDAEDRMLPRGDGRLVPPKCGSVWMVC